MNAFSGTVFWSFLQEWTKSFARKIVTLVLILRYKINIRKVLLFKSTNFNHQIDSWIYEYLKKLTPHSLINMSLNVFCSSCIKSCSIVIWRVCLIATNSALYSIVIGRVCFMLPTLLFTVLLLEGCALCYQLWYLQYCYWKDVLNCSGGHDNGKPYHDNR